MIDSANWQLLEELVDDDAPLDGDVDMDDVNLHGSAEPALAAGASTPGRRSRPRHVARAVCSKGV